MTSGVKVIKCGGGGLLVFLEPLTKISWGLCYIFLMTLHPATFVTVDDPTHLQHRIFVLWGHQVFDGYTSFEVVLNPIVAAFLLYTLTQPLVVMVQLCRVWGCCSVEWYLFCFSSFRLGCSSSSLLYSKPIWGN